MDGKTGIGRIKETGEIILIIDNVEITLPPDRACVLRNGLCMQLGIPAQEEVEVFEGGADYLQESRIKNEP